MKYYILIAAALLYSCGSAVDSSTDHDHPKEAEAHAEASEEIVLTPTQLSTYGIADEKIIPASFNEVIHASGRILPSSGDQAIVAATASGIVTFATTPLNLGSKVGSGQTLFNISAEKLPDGEPAARVRATYIAAQKAYERAKALAADQIVSQRDLENAELAYRTAQIAYEAQKSSSSSRGISVAAPFAGYVTSIDITGGSYVALGTPLATIAKNQRLTLRADVAAKYFRSLPSITAANFSSAHTNKLHSTRDLNGRKVASSTALADGSSMLTIDFEIDNRGDLLPGSLIDIYLIGAPRADVLSVPVSALLEQEGHYYIMVRLDEECFVKREVELGSSSGERTEITAGLKAGEAVVTHGAFQVKMAAAGTAIPAGHTH
ncbi:MAG: efflux RND transporter periplasmic adaptor subunit [Mucinivorans sp.]